MQRLIDLIITENGRTYSAVPKSKREEMSDPAFCVICQELFQRNEEVIELNCSQKHVFHQECLVDWALIKMDCPICREDFNPEKQDPTPEVHMNESDLASPDARYLQWRPPSLLRDEELNMSIHTEQP